MELKNQEEAMEQYETTLRDYMRVLFRQKAVIITAFITVMLTVILGITLKTPVYESQVKLLISGEKQVEATYYRELMAGGRNVEIALTQSEIVKSNPVIERAIKSLGLNQKPLDYEKKFCSPLKSKIVGLQVKMMNAKLERLTQDQKQVYLFRMAMEDLKHNIKVEPLRDTNIFTISVRDFSPIGAAIITNVVSRSYIIFDLEQQQAELQLKYGEKHQTVLQLKDNIDKMIKNNLNGQPLPDIEAIGPASVKIIEQASVPLEAVGPSPVLIIILAFFMSIFLGVMLAFMFEYLDQTFKSPSDIEAYLNVPCLGSVPRKAKLKSYDTLAEQIVLLAKDKNLKSLLFTTASPDDESDTLIVNVGHMLAEKEHLRVLVIDANFRKLSLKKYTKLPAGPGLVDVIEEKVTFEKSVQTLGKNLTVLSSGETALNPVTLLESGKMSLLLAQATKKYDLVLVTAPDLTKRDSYLLSTQVDGVVLVVNEGKTRKQVVKAVLVPLQEKKAHVLGVVLNNRRYAIPKAIYDRV
ncbi:MAG: GNVR domain-containing protein [Candidatus Omnitrophota bacterium]|jgi:capsular exopolysaccharide synthesis family protein